MIVVGKEIISYYKMCQRCRTIIKFFDEDIQRGTLRIFDKIKCPCCDRDINVFFREADKTIV